MYFTSDAVAVIATSAVFPVLALIAILFRWRAKHLKRKAFDASDALMVVTLVIQFGSLALNIVGVLLGGLGYDPRTLSPDKIVVLEKFLFATQLFYKPSVTAVKISIVLFYKSVFSASRSLQIASNIAIAIVMLWFSSIFLATLFQVWPIQANWEPISYEYKINENALYVAEASTDIVLDLGILLLPVIPIYHLHVNFRKKLMLIGIFWLGLFCVVASSVRLHYMVVLGSVSPGQGFEFTDTVIGIIVWSAVEPCMSVVAGCLPLYGPLVQKGGDFFIAAHWIASVGTLLTRGRSESKSNSKSNSERFTATEKKSELAVASKGTETSRVSQYAGALVSADRERHIEEV